MKPSAIDIQFLQARKVARFARRYCARFAEANAPARFVDAAINLRANVPRNRDAGNFVALLNLWRANNQRGYKSETLAEYLRYLWRKDSDKGRANVAGRMLRKLTNGENSNG